MRDVEAHFESVQDDRERRSGSGRRPRTWRLRRLARGELEKAREKEADAERRRRERDERVRRRRVNWRRRRRSWSGEAHGALGAGENKLAAAGAALAACEGARTRARDAAGRVSGERLETQRWWRERQRPDERQRQRQVVDEASATHAKEHARLRARAESAEAAVEELRRAYAARSLRRRRCRRWIRKPPSPKGA